MIRSSSDEGLSYSKALETSEYSWNALGVAKEDFSNNDGLLEQDEEEELQLEFPQDRARGVQDSENSQIHFETV